MIGSMVGSYKVTEKIGEGGMGSVFKGIDVMLEREVAIKMLRPELASQPHIVERFRTEAVTLAKLNHPYIATLYSFLRQGEDYFMVMEYVKGETVDNMIRMYGAMPVERAISLFCHALEGIEHAHKLGIIHRDIKPANIMLTDTGIIKVMDFGIARVLGTSRMTKQGNIIGTIEYMSPEQVRGDETDARADIYSLGILLYEMLTGRVPFNAHSEFELMRSQIEDAPTPPRTFAAHIPLPVEMAIMRSLAKRPEARFQSAGEFRAVLAGNLSSASTTPIDQSKLYAAPATRLTDPVGGPQTHRQPPQMPQSQPTQFAAQTAPISPPSSQMAANMMNETRVLPVVGQPAFPQAAAPYPAQASQAQPSRSKLNWKHYAAAGALLLAIIAVPLALIGGGSQSAPAPTAVQPDPVPAAAEQTPTAAPVQASPQPTTATEMPTLEAPAAAADSTADTEKTNRARSARPEKVAEQTPQPQPQSPAPTQTAPPPTQAPPQQAQQQPKPAYKEDKVATTKEPEKKEEAKEEKKKEKEKKEKGVGGFFKKIFGGDKKEKKP